MAQYEDSARYTRNSLHMDSLSGHTDDESSNASPSSAATTNSPTATFSPNTLVKQEVDDDKEPSSGPQRNRSSSISAGKSDKEKRKRSRVTPEQLVHLERYFAMDRSPTASRRRDISDLLGMQERQTQIWFQNRRAKAKLQDGKHGSRGDSMEALPDAPPELSPGFEVDLHNLIHEDEPVTIIPCSNLTVGTWRRIATSPGKNDLIAYVSEAKKCLTWFIHSGGYGFKMEIPFDAVTDTEFSTAAPGSGLAVFVLSRPPFFYLENLSSPRSDGSVVRTWKRCSDWTEGHQATHVLRHTLIGSAVSLAHVLRNLHHNTNVSELPLRRPSYRPESLAPSSMEIPPPPMASLNAPVLPYPGFGMKDPQLSRLEQNGKRLSYGAIESGYTALGDLQPPPHSAPAATFPQHSYLPPRGSASATFEPRAYHDYQSNPHQRSAIAGYHDVHVPQSVNPGSYPAQPQLYYNNNPRASHADFQSEVHRLSPGLPQPLEYNTSSPLLTTPYHPASNINQPSNNYNFRPPSPPPSSGMPGMVYEVDEDLRGRRSN